MHLGLSKFSIFLGALIFLTPDIAAQKAQHAEKNHNPADSEHCQEKLALSGDGKAAMKCADYYVHDMKMRRYWVIISAENGDPIGQYNLAMELFSRNGSAERVRAIFWMKKSARQGDGGAKEVLEELRLNPDASVPPAPPMEH